MPMIKVEFCKASVFGELALKFIHTPAEHFNSRQMKMILKNFDSNSSIWVLAKSTITKNKSYADGSTMNNYFSYSTLTNVFVAV